MLAAIVQPFFYQVFIALLLLIMGDFISTFCYHIPEHVFGSLHLQTHHSAKKTFRHYAILTISLPVLLDGLLGALPYLFLAILLWPFSPIGVTFGLILGQIHVWWRHVSILGWQTPRFLKILCHALFITTPDRHWLHHQKTSIAFGDIFTFYEQPAKIWLRWLRFLRLHLRLQES